MTDNQHIESEETPSDGGVHPAGGESDFIPTPVTVVEDVPADLEISAKPGTRSDAAPEPAKLDDVIKLLKQKSNEASEAALPPDFFPSLMEPYYYYFPNYYLWLPSDDFIQIDYSSLIQRLADGVGTKVPDAKHALAIARKLVLLIQNDRFVHSITEAAGFPKGAFTSPAGKRLLICGQANHPEPLRGDWPLFRQFFADAFGEEQTEFLLGPLSVFARHLHALLGGSKSPWERQPMPAVVLTGPPGCGKTLLLSLITTLFGGRSANPFRYFAGRTSFNGELIASEVLAVDDETGSPDNPTRAKMASGLKQWLFADQVRVEAKYKNSVMLPSHSLLIYSLNENPGALMCLPNLEESILDKISLFKASPRPGGFPTDKQEKDALIGGLKAEIPMFLQYLLHEHRIRPELANDRTGIKTFHHPEVMAALSELSPETEALEMILTAFYTKFINKLTDTPEETVKVWSGKGHAMHAILESSAAVSKNRLRQLFTSKSDMGNRLYELSRSHPHIVRRGGKSKKVRTYELWLSQKDFDEILPELEDRGREEPQAA